MSINNSPQPSSNLFAHLAAFYQKAELTRFSEELMPRLLLMIQQRDWIGRRCMDLACGVGRNVWRST